MSRLVLRLLLKLGSVLLLRMHQLAFIVVHMMPLAHHPASLMLAARLVRGKPVEVTATLSNRTQSAFHDEVWSKVLDVGTKGVEENYCVAIPLLRLRIELD